MRVNYAVLESGNARYYEAGLHSGYGTLPLIMVHGAGATADTWVRNLEALGQRRRVLAPDLLGHGLTDGPPHRGRPPQQLQIEHFDRLIEHWGLEDFAILGSSYGALLAALTALRHPEKAKKLILVGSGSTMHPGEDQEHILSAVLKNQLPALHSPTPDLIRQRNVGSNYDKSDTFEEIVVLQMSALAMPGRAEFFEETIKGLIATASDPQWRVYDRLEALALPTLVISGEDDPRAQPEQVREAASRLPDARVEILPRCGHKPFSEQTESFNALVSAFLEEET